MAIHQLIPSFVPGDATGQAALHLQLLLRRMGHAGALYADEVGAVVRRGVDIGHRIEIGGR